MDKANPGEAVLEVKDLQVYFKTLGGTVKAVDGVNFVVRRGRCLGIVGESGCGKSVTARSILRLLPTATTRGNILYWPNGTLKPIDIAMLSPLGTPIRRIRGREIAMIFQEPMTSLTPVYSVGNQVMESILMHQLVSKDKARHLAAEMLHMVGIPDSERRLSSYPHQMSGGMRQRVMIAMALSSNPAVLIADEPTTALDVTIQAQILRLLRRLQIETGLSLVMITHDLSVIANIAEDVVVMYLGQIVEQAPVTEFFENPKHPYSQGLLRSIVLPETEPKSELPAIPGVVPNPLSAPSGCRFRNRCEFATKQCMSVPPTAEISAQHTVTCWLYAQGATSHGH